MLRQEYLLRTWALAVRLLQRVLDVHVLLGGISMVSK